MAALRSRPQSSSVLARSASGDLCTNCALFLCENVRRSISPFVGLTKAFDHLRNTQLSVVEKRLRGLAPPTSPVAVCCPIHGKRKPGSRQPQGVREIVTPMVSSLSDQTPGYQMENTNDPCPPHDRHPERCQIGTKRLSMAPCVPA